MGKNIRTANNLISGNITTALFRLAIPVMGTSFIQMAYNMVDTIWIGRLGSNEVAAVGTAGFYMWLAFGFIVLAKIGAQVNVAQSIGKNDMASASIYSAAGIQSAIILGFLYTLSVYLLRYRLIGFFNIDDAYVNEMAVRYLQIVVFAIFFAFINEAFSGIIIGSGNSEFPFKVNMVGLTTNIILDPILIFGLGVIPAMGARGAAIATLFAQMTVTMIYMIFTRKRNFEFLKTKLFQRLFLIEILENVRIGLPISLHSIFFTLFSMALARIVAVWGPLAIAIQRVGGQIESISWRTADGFSSSLSSFVGQNYGAGEKERVKSGYLTAIRIMTVFGIFTSILLVVFSKGIMGIFIPEAEAIELGSSYLKILGVSQLFMCLEITTQGAFAGMGRTKPPALVSIVFNAARIPIALFLSKTFLDLDGVWWSISLTSIFKGIIMVVWFAIILKKYLKDSDTGGNDGQFMER
jgi:putative MATE family efflux protein